MWISFNKIWSELELLIVIIVKYHEVAVHQSLRIVVLIYNFDRFITFFNCLLIRMRLFIHQRIIIVCSLQPNMVNNKKCADRKNDSPSSLSIVVIKRHDVVKLALHDKRRKIGRF